MFAALTVVRLREAAAAAGLLDTKAWMSPDDVSAVDLPLAKAAVKVLESMQVVLEKTMKNRQEAMDEYEKGGKKGSVGGGVDGVDGGDSEGKKRYLTETRAAEIRVVRNVKDLKEPEHRYKAEALEV